MKTKKKLLIFIVLIMGSILLLSGSFPSVAQAQKTIEWKMLISWGSELPAVQDFCLSFIEKVNQRAGGRMKISWVGPEGVPSFEQFKPVREGLFDALFTVPAYHSNEISLGNGMTLITASAKERRSAGLFKIMDEAYRKKANVTYLTGMPDGVGFQLILRKKIERADLTGLKIRSSPMNDPMIKTLNGVPVRIDRGEIYTALEKGLADGMVTSAVGLLEYHYYEVVKYLIRPLFGEVVNTILVNLNSWNRLPKDLQDLLTKTAVEIEEEGRAATIKRYEIEQKELQKKGMESLVLPPKEAEKYLNAFYESTWEELVLKPNPEFGPRLKEACDRIRKK